MPALDHPCLLQFDDLLERQIGTVLLRLLQVGGATSIHRGFDDAARFQVRESGIPQTSEEFGLHAHVCEFDRLLRAIRSEAERMNLDQEFRADAMIAQLDDILQAQILEPGVPHATKIGGGYT